MDGSENSYYQKAIIKFSERTLNPLPMWSAVQKMEPTKKMDLLDQSRRGPSLKLEITEISFCPLQIRPSKSPAKSILKTCTYQSNLDNDPHSLQNSSLNSCFNPKFKPKGTLMSSSSLVNQNQTKQDQRKRDNQEDGGYKKSVSFATGTDKIQPTRTSQKSSFNKKSRG